MSEVARTRNVWRRLGYRLLPGDTFSYVLHLRPAEWPIMAAHTALGFVLALGLLPTLRGEGLGTLLGMLAVWVIGLNGGTLAINSAYDHDVGDIGYLIAPPPPPRHLLAFSWVLLAGGQVLALLFPPAFAAVYAVCFAMSVAYSVPPLRLKAVGGVDWLINMWGFGTFTPYAGWAATGRAVDAGGALVLLAFCPLFASLYPLTQLYQFEEDAGRGDHTLAIRLGLTRSLVAAIASAVVAFGVFAAAGVVRGLAWWQWGALAVALAAWLLVLLPWHRRAPSMTPAEHQRGMYAALGAWAVTDVAVIISFAFAVSGA
jgi:4-hydroxybenzoate polyprenyltransferase